MSQFIIKLFVFGACSLAASTSSVLCGRIGNNFNKSPAVSYNQQSPLEAQQFNDERSLLTASEDFGSSLIPTTNALQQTQPSVYHSIIDRTATPSRPASLAVQASTAIDGDLHTAAGHHHGHAHGKYYEYRAVPKKKTWKFGYKRGNHKHTISRHEHGKAGKHPHFKTKVKWHDKKSKGKGIHLWDYNHHDKKHHYGHHG